jgi:hypothetical protein
MQPLSFSMKTCTAGTTNSEGKVETASRPITTTAVGARNFLSTSCPRAASGKGTTIVERNRRAAERQDQGDNNQAQTNAYRDDEAG